MLTTDQRNRWVQASWPELLALLNLQIVPGQSSGSWAGPQFGSHGQALPTRSVSRGEGCGERPEKAGSCLPAAATEESEDCMAKMRQHFLPGLEAESSGSRYSTNKRVTFTIPQLPNLTALCYSWFLVCLILLNTLGTLEVRGLGKC